MTEIFSRTRRSLLCGGAGILGGMSLVGCSGESKPSATALAELSLQLPWVNDAEFIGYFIAMEEGLYKSAGLNFNYLRGGPDKIADEILFAKKSDIALTNPETTFNLISKRGAPFKVIGTQYHKSPLGIVSLAKSNINEPKDLIGKRLAVPDANKITAEQFLLVNDIDPKAVKIVPYTYDPRPLVQGAYEASIDFVTNVPYTIRLLGEEPADFLLYDHKFRVFMDTVVVTEETLKNKRSQLVSFLKASRKGWETNFGNIDRYPKKFMSSYFKGTGRTEDNEVYFNKRQRPYIEQPDGIFAMTESGIADTIASLKAIGITAARDSFVTDLLK